MLAVANAFDATTSDALYRDALPIRVAGFQLVLGRGTQFDPSLVEVFERWLAKHQLD